MSFDTRQVGVTGPSARIGGSSDYHIDTKFSQSLPLKQRVEAFTALAKRYADEGRTVEFSNQGVAGMVFDPNAPYDQRQSIYQQATAAHAPRQGFDSLDYYVPLQGHDRWHSSAEGAPIYVPMQQGQSLYRGQGGGYGRFADVSSTGGQVLYRSGHGDTGSPVGEAPQETAQVAQQEPPSIQLNQAAVIKGPQQGQAPPGGTPPAPPVVADKPETAQKKKLASSLADGMKKSILNTIVKDVVEPFAI